MIITNAKLISWDQPNQIHENFALYIKNGVITEMDEQQILLSRYPEAERVDAGGQFVMPGMICAHTHFYGAFSRGMAIPGRAPKDFPEILEKLWWRLDKALTPEAVLYSALVCLVDAIRHGTTLLFDHHASVNAIPGSLDLIASAVDQAEVRASLCYEVSDRDGEEKTWEGIRENVRFIERIQRENPFQDRITAIFGLHASLTLSDKTLASCRDAVPDDTGFHIHVAEHPVDQDDSLAKSGTRVVDRLHQHGILGPKSIAVHAVHVDAKEIALLAQTGTWVTHQPRSNMNNAVGISDAEAMMRAGIKICLGNDGFSNAMWEEWKTAYLVHKLWNRDPRKMAGDMLIEMAVYNNADMANTFFPGKPFGVLKPGARADLIFVDYQPITPLHARNLPWHILFGFRDSMVTSTMVDGKFLMRNRDLLTLDEEKISFTARKIAAGVWKKFEEYF